MHYIKLILFLSIGLIFATEKIHSKHLNRRRTFIDCLRYIRYMNKLENMPRYNLWHYTVDLDIETLYGNVNMDICVSLPNPSALTIHTGNLTISNLLIWPTSEQNKINRTFYINNYTVTEYGNMIIDLEDYDMPPGFYTLHIGFTFNIKNPLQLRDFDLKPFFMAQSIQKLFPSWKTKLNEKVTFDLSMWALNDYMFLSNGLLSIGSLKQSEFKTISMMSENELVIVLLPTRHATYRILRTSNIYSMQNPFQDPPFIIKIWSRTDTILSTLSFAQNVISNVTRRLFQYTNETYPYLKIDHVIIPDVPYEISKNSHRGIIIYRKEQVVYEKEKDPLPVKFDVIKIIISKVARQWIGGLVTPKISDSWISQSFAKFFQLYIFNQMLGKKYEMFLLMDFFGSSFLLDNGGTNMQLSLPPVLVEKVHYNEDIVYEKGALLLRMLQNIIKNETFQRGVFNLLNKDEYEFELITTDDLWSAMQTALYATSKSKIDIKTVMDTYVKRKSYPIVVVKRDYETGETIISQQPYDTFYMLHDVNVIDHISDIESESNSSEWWIPVNWATEFDPFFDDTTPTLWLGAEDKTINIRTNPDDWIIINLQQTGYYRVHYDRTNWEKIGNFLQNEDYTKIHVLNRAQLIYDICDMFQNGRIDSALFMNFTSYLSREMDYIVWNPMLTRCLQSRDLNIYLNFPENKWLQVHLARLFEGIILSNIEYELDFKKSNDDQSDDDKPDDDIRKLMRKELINEACRLGNTQCRKTARDRLEMYLTDPSLHQLLQQSEFWMFCYGLKTANNELWHKVSQLLREQKKSLCPLACTEDSNIIMKFLHTIAENDTYIEKLDVPFLIQCIAKYSIDNEKVFSYLLKAFVTKKHFHKHVFGHVLDLIHTEDQLSTIFIVITNTYMTTDTYSDDEYFQYNKKIKERKQELRDVQNKFKNVLQRKR